MFEKYDEDDDQDYEEHFLTGPVQNWSTEEKIVLFVILFIASALLLFFAWLYIENQKENTKKINSIKQRANGHKLHGCDDIKIAEVKTKFLDESKYAPCTCYYDKNELIMGCTDNTKKFIKNNYYYPIP
jgi:hypothetical protein